MNLILDLYLRVLKFAYLLLDLIVSSTCFFKPSRVKYRVQVGYQVFVPSPSWWILIRGYPSTRKIKKKSFFLKNIFFYKILIFFKNNYFLKII